MARQQQRASKREAFWRGVMTRFDRSELTAREFCAREQLSEPSFYHWRRVLRQRDAERAALPGAPAFLPVVVPPACDAAAEHGAEIEIEVRGGFRSCVVRLPAALPMRQVAELVCVITAAPGIPGAGVAMSEARL